MRYPTLNAGLEHQAERTPDATALICNGQRFTYAQLNDEANRRARWLIEQGVHAEMFVGVVMDHNIDLIVDIFAIMKSGAAYIAMEPTFPEERIRYIVEQANIAYVFTHHEYAPRFDDKTELVFPNRDFSAYSESDTGSVNSESNAAYVLYTSGTTGRPKGVVIEQRNVCNYVHAFQREFKPTPADRMLQNSVCTFDIFVEEVFPILLSGGTLVIASQEQKRSIGDLLAVMERERVTIISGFPYLLADMDGRQVPKHLRLALSGGDVLRPEHIQSILGDVTVYNTYGPTETTVCATYYRCPAQLTPGQPVPVGKSICGAQVHLLDDKLQSVQRGQMGEICITGDGVSRGYLGMPEETAKHFVGNPFGSGAMYLTGDMGWQRDDGAIVFVKRRDEQVMIEGRRVEPMEVENVMYRFPRLGDAAVRSYLDERDYPYLVGYYSAEDSIDPSVLRRHMERFLPEFMIPESLIQIPQMPKNQNGKIDRRQLPFVQKKAVRR